MVARELHFSDGTRLLLRRGAQGELETLRGVADGALWVHELRKVVNGARCEVWVRIDQGPRDPPAARRGHERRRAKAPMAPVIERDLRGATMAAQIDAIAQRDALWHLLEACESFGGPTVRALARKRYEVFDGADVREDHQLQGSVAAELVVALDW